ncbi:MAG: hemerythrin domain-containing protein [Clostridiales bacterium]|jgi:hemerythrin-like domain-containing protein|uniref:hemerythrin domain-containing protein n=1 Tax=Aminipila sp. TaxID=2060095 RepID=UPI001DC28B38|nr:hemerythrin domain-containing protein [Aminipila sp.]MBE6033786.1 hemerythrin domain-containing protein [Clostridiales bacterium]
MNYIEMMVEEHTNIKRMLSVIRKYCYKVLKNEELDYEDFFMLIDFVRNYADKHHHGKEEKLLFDMMMKELGPTAEKLVRNGMLVEHDLGRLHMQELETAVKKVIEGDDEARLDVIANAISYTHLLHRHIDKEDNVVYQFAQKNLSAETQEMLERECRQFEQDAKDKNIQKKYLDMIIQFEDKVQ